MMERVIDFSYQAVNPFGIWDQADMTLYPPGIGDFLFLGGVILILLGIT
ncbi:MAG TPA: hypothetical protein VI146_05560 [Nitrososphaeraceae archaeon]